MVRGVDHSAADALSRNAAFAAVSTCAQCRLASGEGDHLPDRLSNANPSTQPDLAPVRTPNTATATVHLFADGIQCSKEEKYPKQDTHSAKNATVGHNQRPHIQAYDD
jgi:hypothetical protein